MNYREALMLIEDLVVEQLDVSRDQVTENTRLADDLGADSLDLAELEMELEDGTDMSVLDDEIAEKPVGWIAGYFAGLTTARDILEASYGMEKVDSHTKVEEMGGDVHGFISRLGKTLGVEIPPEYSAGEKSLHDISSYVAGKLPAA